MDKILNRQLYLKYSFDVDWNWCPCRLIPIVIMPHQHASFSCHSLPRSSWVKQRLKDYFEGIWSNSSDFRMDLILTPFIWYHSNARHMIMIITIHFCFKLDESCSKYIWLFKLFIHLIVVLFYQFFYFSFQK